MESFLAWGIGLATVTESGRTLDVWYPEPHLGPMPEGGDPELLNTLSQLERNDEARGVHTSVVRCVADLHDQPGSTADAYLRLHLLSHRLVQPNTMNLDGMLSRLPVVVWTSAGPCSINNFETTRYRLRAQYGHPIGVVGVDKFPPMVNYVVPSGVRIADGARVRLGAHLAAGTTVAHGGVVNYNSGTLGRCSIEGRLAQGVVIGENTDIGAGASTMSMVADGSGAKVSMGENCLLGANSGLGIPLGDDCVVESGLYLTGTTQVSLMLTGGVVPGDDGMFVDPVVVPALDLAGASNVLFRRNSVNGRVEALARGGKPIRLADGSTPSVHS
ncbi:DapH/DapD/GlmU-related protein [Scrofimicrobium sp. R131]|uniref:2,3,4,5-tetrahydropyridine-2,6-dicarboxylate N-succinyltransferase n=1 Tax=Scrofimicrobium appendicitidis TaxID=3079930 RepID=A0AAU7V7I8_9ACTO